MRAENDWRLQGQEAYLKGISLWWMKYSPYSGTWEHDHCEFCGTKFMDEDNADVITHGYSTNDKYRWICETCFEDFHDLFNWTVVVGKNSDELS
jgi:hypothetical protein